MFYIAAQKGLDPDREYPWDLKAGFHAETNLPLSVREFLLLTDGRASEQSIPAAPGTVRCSIIIPVRNKAEYTLQCLRSLMRETDFCENEVVVIDNASSDETERLLSRMSGTFRVIRNEDNKGFVEACNQGASAANGTYLVFLNNDTVVLPGWLDHLVKTAEDDASVGAVGSMLVYPDGRLQEAGGIIWRDGTGNNYGRGEKPSRQKFAYAREVDYCSGASLLVRRTLFERVGGFDRRYAPAYYEDTDLCFSVRALGFKVVYQPSSRVIHFEGVTAGRDVSTGYKRYQEINRAKFVEKWRDVLEREHWKSDCGLLDVAADRNLRLTIAPASCVG